MDGRLALYSGAVFAGVLLAGALVIKPGLGDSSGAVNTGDPNSANTSTSASTGQSGDNRGFVSRLTSFVRGGDDGDDEHEGDEHAPYEHEGDDD